MKKLDFDIVPLVIVAILILITLYVISTSNYILSLKHYIGFTCFTISSFFYIKNRLAYYLIFGLTLLAGVFGLLECYFQTYKIGFGGFGISPVYITILIVHFTLAFEITKKNDANR